MLGFSIVAIRIVASIIIAYYASVGGNRWALFYSLVGLTVGLEAVNTSIKILRGWVCRGFLPRRNYD